MTGTQVNAVEEVKQVKDLKLQMKIGVKGNVQLKKILETEIRATFRTETFKNPPDRGAFRNPEPNQYYDITTHCVSVRVCVCVGVRFAS